METCSLCDSYANEKYRVIYDDGTVFVMMNNQPLKDGHVIILPVRHAENMADLTPAEAGGIFALMERCMRAAEKFGGESSFAAVNSQVHRSQPHFHAHVLPSKVGLRGLLVAAEGVDFRSFADTATLEQNSKRFSEIFE